MATTPVGFAAKDNASSLLNASISASDLSIPLATGGGASFPQPYSGTATSGGTSTTLNSTGISATIGGSAQEGKIIWNRTDNSFAIITAVAANALTTTRLLGGTDQTWQNADQWVIDGFVGTLERISTSAYGVQSTTQQEEVLIIGRSTDTITVASSGRGYNGSTANTWTATDYMRVNVTAPVHERFKDVVAELAKGNDTNTTNIATNTSDLINQKTGAYHYVVATGSSNAYAVATPALAAYAAGNLVRFKANHNNTGAATLNVNGLGAQAIKKKDGATALALGDIKSGQVVTVVYDGTNFQMLSPIGQDPATKSYVIGSQLSTAGGDTVGNTGTATNFASSNDIAADTLAAGDVIEIYASGHVSTAAANTDLLVTYRMDTTDIVSNNTQTFNASMTSELWEMRVHCTVQSVSGTTCTLMCSGMLFVGSSALSQHQQKLKTDFTGAPDPVTVDSTQVLTCVPRIDWTTADSSNTITMQQHTVKITKL